MALRDKTNQRFKDFFIRIAKLCGGKEFEVAFSEIQRETGAANITMKRAIEALVAEGWLEVKPGRNSRYARFFVASLAVEEVTPEEATPTEKVLNPTPESDSEQSNLKAQIYELENIVENLRRRLRTQEMTIALLQDRIAEIEDKLHKR